MMKHKLLFFITLQIIFCCCTMGNHVRAQVTTVRIVPHTDNQCMLVDRERSSSFMGVKACRGNTVMYEAVGNNILQYEWTVTGGTYTLSAGQDICTVTWGNGDMGRIEVLAKGASDSKCSDWLEVLLEDKPVCRSVTRPAYITNPPYDDAKTIYVCMGDSLLFVDNSYSTTTPITRYYWHSPWGVSNYSTYSFVAGAIGTYNVEHRVYNECGCYDEEIITLIVGEQCPLALSCYGTVCAGDIVEYTASFPSCTHYYWDVEGGTLISGQGFASIGVVWDAPESGYGILTLDGTPCECGCQSPKTIKVPVISDAVSISGKEVICTDQEELYTLPLWGGTAYEWDINPPTNDITMSGDSTNELTLRITATGTYTITAKYRCEFLDCGPYYVTKTIFVKEPLYITDPQTDRLCPGTPTTFSTNASTNCMWSIRKNGVSKFQSPTPSSTLTYTFDESGVYTITAENADFCNQAIKVVTVFQQPPPPMPNEIHGPKEVCPEYSYNYSATTTGPDYYIEWTWWNGTGPDSAVCTGENVMIKYGSQVSDISVRQVDRRTGCRSKAERYHVSAFDFGAWPYTDDINVCEGQTFELDRLASHEVTVLYKWTADPSHTLSVIGDHLQPNVAVLANYSTPSPRYSAMILERRACGVKKYDTAMVHIGVIDAPQLALLPTYCANILYPLRMTADSDWGNADSTHSYWEVSDGSVTFNVYRLPGIVKFPSAGNYTITLHYVSKLGCTATCSTNVTVNAFPELALVESGANLCVQVDPSWPSSNTLNYTWSTGDITWPCISTPPLGPVMCHVEYVGCSTDLVWNGPEQGVSCTTVNNAFSVSHVCNNIMEVTITDASVMLRATLYFMCANTSVDEIQLTRTPQRVLVPQSCVDGMRLSWRNGGLPFCSDIVITPVTGTLLNFDVSSDCFGNIVVTDNTQYLTPMPPRQVMATHLGNMTSQQVNFQTGGTIAKVPSLATLTEGATFRVRITVGNDPNCYIEYDKYFDPKPRILSLNLPTNMCEGIPMPFSASAVGCKLEYRWDFDDGSYNYGNGIYHTYTFNNNNSYHPILQVTDCQGCTATSRGDDAIDVFLNQIVNQDIECTAVACHGDAMKLSYTPNNPEASYTWTPSACTTRIAQVYAGGDYTVLEEIATTGCRGEYSDNFSYPNEIIAQIRCQSDYCEGDEVTAVGDVGSQYQYSWKLYDSDNTLIGTSVDANYTFTVDAADTYRLLLVVGDNTCNASCSTAFTVHPRPAAPTIVYGENSCIDQGPVQLESTNNQSLVWSNGSYGTTATYYTAGRATAYYVDAYGCKSLSQEITIYCPPNFDGLLTGCYGICPDDLPIVSVYTLGPVVGVRWRWTWNGSAILRGAVPAPPMSIALPTYGPGDYQLVFDDYGSECLAQSPILTLESLNCNNTGGGGGAGTIVHALTCSPTVLKCEADGCLVRYTAQVTVCNRTSSPVTVASIGCASLTVAVSTVLPKILLPDECLTIDFSFYYDFTSPAAVLFTVSDGLREVGRFAIRLNDCLDCLNPDNCDFDIDLSANINTTYSILNQTIYYDLTFTHSSSGVQILAVWCAGAGEMVSGTGGGTYQGLFSISYGQLTQLVQEYGEVCFDVLCCVDDKMPCLKHVCIASSDIHTQCTILSQTDKQPDKRGDAHDGKSWHHYRLVPNPTMGKVCVVETITGAEATDVNEVEVLSLTGQTLLRHVGGGWIDLANLPSGSYMVRICTEQGIETQKLVVKRQ